MGNIYIGNNNIARKSNKIYVGVNGVARRVQKIYIGDANGIAREVYTAEVPKIYSFQFLDIHRATPSSVATISISNGGYTELSTSNSYYHVSENSTLRLSMTSFHAYVTMNGSDLISLIQQGYRYASFNFRFVWICSYVQSYQNKIVRLDVNNGSSTTTTILSNVNLPSPAVGWYEITGSASNIELNQSATVFSSFNIVDFLLAIDDVQSFLIYDATARLQGFVTVTLTKSPI